MYNWSINTKEIRKDKATYSIWKLEQLINFGMGNSKIKKQKLLQLMPSLDIDPAKKKYLSFLLWPRKQS
ncbi:hypothetical protein A3B60_02750 [Candidatus Peregrinibacteria bacterium RIFCSPLOWO2_01_FULL_39_12]|nr:MAG: hypothetical protein A3I58_02610 [Candidatus Peregrinibacteria bacterium RIFCSPLOWO2_02_FULL_39_10]OGJ42659.1 MAG: hypothetical protein A3B60_02750 [Candidatus Peregrinibacteria bacterium RIFCSPLOWO2_01_FULL_39_12]